MPPVWVSHYKDIERLHHTWQGEFEKRAIGGMLALSGYHYQFLIALHDTLRAWLAKPAMERNIPSVLTECLTDILNRSADDIILLTQVKRTRRSGNFKDALTELWLIYDLAVKTTPLLAPFLRFRILSKKAELKDFESILNNWQPEEKYSSSIDTKDFCGKVTVEIFSNPEDEVLSLLANKFRAAEPIGYVQRWLGKLLEAAGREDLTGFEYAAKSIWADLQSLENSAVIAPSSVYVWTSNDKAPEDIEEGNVLTGERPQVHHLRQGCFAPRSEVYQPIVEKIQEWIIDLTDNQDKQLRLPVFWIGGRSGSGKSVALMHVLALLYESGIGSIFWLGNKTELLRQAIPWALKFKAENRQAIIGIDDPYAPNTQNDDLIWKEVLAVLESVRQDGDASALPLIICCGPTEQAERMQIDLPEDVNINLYELPAEERKDILQLRNWYIQRTKKSPPKIDGENVLLVQLFFEWETGQSLPQFAARFRNRIKESDRQGILENLVTRMLCVNRLYVGYPINAVEKYLAADLQDIFHRLREEYHIAQTVNEYGIGFWLAHAHLSNVIYESWYPLHNSRAVRSDHLRQVIRDSFEFGSSASEKTAPLWAISNATFEFSQQNSFVGRLDEETVINLLPFVYTSRLQESGERIALDELPVWIQLQAFFSEAVLKPNPVDEALKQIKIENLGKRGLRLTCHKLLQHYNSFSEMRQSKVVEVIIRLLTENPNWYGWAPIAVDLYRRTKSPQLVKLVIDWVVKRPRLKWSERLFFLIFDDNPTDSQILNAARNLLSRTGGELGWGDIAIQVMEQSADSDVPAPVLQWAKNNYQQWGACFLLGKLLGRRFISAKHWALEWCERWHKERSANFILEPLLDLVEPNEKMRNWCLSWIAINQENVDATFLLEKMIRTFSTDNEVLSIGVRWLETNDSESGSWTYLWHALYQVNAFGLSNFLDGRTKSLLPASESAGDQAGKGETSIIISNKLAELILVNPKTCYNVAIGFSKTERYDEAIPALKKAVELKPDFVEAWQALKSIYKRLEQYELALQASVKVTELKPDDPEAWYYSALNFNNVERYEDAVAALEKAVELRPDFAEAWQALGAVYNHLEQYEQALRAAVKLTELKPDDPEAWYYLSIAYGRSGNNKDRIATLKKTIELKPDFIEAWQLLGSTYNSLEQYELALQATTKLTELKPDDPEIWYYLALIFSKKRRYEDAILTLKKTIELKPDFVEAWQALGAIYNQLGQYEQALQAIIKLTELKPDDPEIWYYLSIAYGRFGNNKDRIAPLIKAIELKPDLAEAWQALGATYNSLRQYEQALQAVIKVAELKPDDPETWYYLSIAYGKIGRYEEEIAPLIKAVELRPDFAEAWQALGAVYNHLEQYEQALRAAVKLTELKPDDPEAWYYLSIAYGRYGDNESEIGALEKLAELDPDVVKLRKLLHHEYYDKGRYEIALEAVLKIIKLNLADADDFYTLGLIYFKMERFREASEALTKVTTFSADTMLAQERLSEAITLIEALKNQNLEPRGLNTDESIKFYKAGRDYVDSGEIDEAAKAFHKSIKASTDEAKSISNMLRSLIGEATMAFHSKSYERAIILLKIIVTIDQSIPYVWRFLSSSYYRLGKYQESLDAAKRLADLTPTSEVAWYKLGKRYIKVGQIDDAIKAFNQALQLNKNFKSARRELQKTIKTRAIRNFED